jgi:uncharacterized membrane protein
MNLITIFQAIAGFILIFFVPGYALSWTFYPFRDELTQINRIALSLVLSVASVMASVLFVDVYLGVDFTPINIVITILLLTALAIIAWRIRIIDAGKMRKKIKMRFLAFHNRFITKILRKWRR